MAQEQTLKDSRFDVQWKCRSKGYDSEAGKRSGKKSSVNFSRPVIYWPITNAIARVKGSNEASCFLARP